MFIKTKSPTPTHLAKSHWAFDRNKLSPSSLSYLKKKKGRKKKRSLCHNDSFKATAHIPVHLKFIKFQFPQMPSSNNIVIQEVKDIIYPNSLYTYECLARLAIYIVMLGSLLYLTSSYINFGQKEFYILENVPIKVMCWLATHSNSVLVSIISNFEIMALKNVLLFSKMFRIWKT